MFLCNQMLSSLPQYWIFELQNACFFMPQNWIFLLHVLTEIQMQMTILHDIGVRFISGFVKCQMKYSIVNMGLSQVLCRKIICQIQTYLDQVKTEKEMVCTIHVAEGEDLIIIKRKENSRRKIAWSNWKKKLHLNSQKAAHALANETNLQLLIADWYLKKKWFSIYQAQMMLDSWMCKRSWRKVKCYIGVYTQLADHELILYKF